MLIFDGRRDADALYWKHDVQIRGVLDLRTMAMLLRQHPSMYRTSYTETMSQYAGLHLRSSESGTRYKTVHSEVTTRSSKSDHYHTA